MDVWALTDLATPWCVHVVVTLRVPEQLAAGPAAIGDLASAVRADPDALARVLRHLVSKGLFEEPSPGRFALNDSARALLEPGPRLGLDLDGFGGRMANAWSSLLTAVRTGSPAYDAVFGRPFWDDLAAHPSISADFDALMGPGHGTPDPDVLPDGDWSSVKTVVDVGGGTGALLAEILRAHPAVRGTLVDLPATVARSREVFAAAGVADRVTTIGQSFFDPLPRGADLYVMKSVLSDWSDREAAALLARCAEAARPAGRIVIVGGVTLDPVAASPALLMLVLVGGKERTLDEFRALARGAGLDVAGTGRQKSGKSLVVCRPTR
ncbi:MAG TPA: methyltransferase [Vicinamibacterales bacterium]|nr:methyltransferase [Vicinamibacterales bacterium]